MTSTQTGGAERFEGGENMQKPRHKNAPCLLWQNPTFLIISSFCLEKKKKGSSQSHFGNWIFGYVNFISYFSESNFIWQKPARENSPILIFDSGFDWCDLKLCKQILLFPCFAKTLGLVKKTLCPQKTRPDCDLKKKKKEAKNIQKWGYLNADFKYFRFLNI